MNKEWHASNRMPQKPTLDQRIEWHTQHATHCDCREIPARIEEEIEKRQLQRRIVGSVLRAPRDLSTNRKYFKGFGKEK